MKFKKKNKGFSLVELIVVMAIMAILAVALAPRLIQYVDRARQAQDRETVNSIYTAVKYGLMENNISTTTIYDLNKYTYTGAVWGQDDDSIYDVSDEKTYKVKTDGDNFDEAIIKEIVTTIPSFKLKSNLASKRTKITITIKSDTEYQVVLDYDGDKTVAGVDLTTPTENDRYTLDSKTIY